MSRRLALWEVVVTAVVAVGWLGPVAVAGQGRQATGTGARTSSPGPYTQPKTPDGQPDLQGFWTNSTYTPLERPKSVEKEFYTPAEAAAAIKLAAQRENELTTPGTTEDVHYDFKQFGLGRGPGTLPGNLRTSLIVDPPDGKVPPLTDEGRKRAAARAEAEKRLGGRGDPPESNQLDDRGLFVAGGGAPTTHHADRSPIRGGPGPPMMNAAYNANYQIVQGPGYVMILTEMIHDARIVPLDGRPQTDEKIRQWMGVSRGRWEGNTLVVETTNFNGKNSFRGSTENLRVTERFTRLSE